MVYLIFVDGELWTVSTDKDDASIQAHSLMKRRHGKSVKVVAVHGYVLEDLNRYDETEA